MGAGSLPAAYPIVAYPTPTLYLTRTFLRALPAAHPVLTRPARLPYTYPILALHFPRALPRRLPHTLTAPCLPAGHLPYTPVLLAALFFPPYSAAAALSRLLLNGRLNVVVGRRRLFRRGASACLSHPG